MKYLGIMLDCKMDWFPHTQYLENKLLHIRNNLARCSKPRWGLSYANLVTVYKLAITLRHPIRGRGLAQLNIQTRKVQIDTNPEILSHIPNEGLQDSLTRGNVSNRMANAHRPRTQLIQRQNSNPPKAYPTNAVIVQLKIIETPHKRERERNSPS